MWDVSSILLLSINKDKTMTSLFTDYFSTVGAFTLVKEASQTKKTSFSGETLKTDLSICTCAVSAVTDKVKNASNILFIRVIFRGY